MCSEKIKTIAFLGDSITYGYALEDKESRYSALVAKALDMTEVNFGITGTLLAKAGLNQTDEKDFLSRAHLIDEADAAVIFGGTNDYFWSDKPIAGEDDSYFAHAVQTLIDRVKEKRAGRVTLFVTPYPHNGVGNYLGGAQWRDASRHDTDARNYNGHTLKEYADVIVTLCEKNGMPCLNLFEDFGFHWREHTCDGCHPNEAGHLLLAEAVTGRMRELIGK